MKKIFLLLMPLILMFSYPLHTKGETPLLTWEDLIPKEIKSKGLLANLNDDQRDMVYWVIHTLENLPERTKENEKYYEEVDSVMPMLKKEGIDIEKVMAKREEIRNAVVSTLNLKTVSLKGYLLPLETSKKKVTEFLLVPYIGACIHVPPPPPNQIVHVTVVKNGGYRHRKLYEPVKITGRIFIKKLVKSLYLVDGSADISVGYAFEASTIVPFKE